MKAQRRLPLRPPGTLWDRLRRVVKYRLVVPIMRSRHPPEHTAHGVMVGLFCACLPSPVGQMGLAVGAWVLARRLFRWDFSLIQAVAWTWATNVFTAPPIYYFFFLTGQVLLGRWDDLSGYSTFVQTFTDVVENSGGVFETVKAVTHMIVVEWGLAMWIGALPWAALSAWLGYRLSLRFIIAYRLARARRIERRGLKVDY